MEFFFSKINPASFLHMFSLGAASSEDRELELALVVFALIQSLCPQAPKYVGLCLAKLLPLHQMVPIKTIRMVGDSSPKV